MHDAVSKYRPSARSKADHAPDNGKNYNAKHHAAKIYRNPDFIETFDKYYPHLRLHENGKQTTHPPAASPKTHFDSTVIQAQKNAEDEHQHVQNQRGQRSRELDTQLLSKLALYEGIATNFRNEGNELEAMKFTERAMELRREIFGEDSKEFRRSVKDFAIKCNIAAMKYLKDENYVLAHDFLKRAEALTEPDQFIGSERLRLKLRAATFNNFGCFLRRRGKLHEALHYIEKALDIEMNSQVADNPAATHLNMCAILSQLGRHDTALEHAQYALIQLQIGTPSASKKKKKDRSMLAVAYHNLAVECEFLNDYQGACQSYARASNIVERDLGRDHPTTLIIQRSYEQAKQLLEEKKARRMSPRNASLRLPRPKYLKSHSDTSTPRTNDDSLLSSRTAPTTARSTRLPYIQNVSSRETAAPPIAPREAFVSPSTNAEYQHANSYFESKASYEDTNHPRSWSAPTKETSARGLHTSYTSEGTNNSYSVGGNGYAIYELYSSPSPTEERELPLPSQYKPINGEESVHSTLPKPPPPPRKTHHAAAPVLHPTPRTAAVPTQPSAPSTSQTQNGFKRKNFVSNTNHGVSNNQPRPPPPKAGPSRPIPSRNVQPSSVTPSPPPTPPMLPSEASKEENRELEEAKLAEAAVKIQKLYKGYSTRKQMQGRNDVSEKQHQATRAPSPAKKSDAGSLVAPKPPMSRSPSKLSCVSSNHDDSVICDQDIINSLESSLKRDQSNTGNGQKRVRSAARQREIAKELITISRTLDELYTKLQDDIAQEQEPTSKDHGYTQDEVEAPQDNADETAEMANAAIKIQAVYRGAKARELARAHKQAQQEHNAATTIQAMFKGAKVRKQIQEVKEQKKQAEILRQQEEEEHAAATKIQATFKGRKARKQLQEAQEQKRQEEAAAIKLQSLYRGSRVRQQIKQNQHQQQQQQQKQATQQQAAALPEEQAAVRIQAAFKGAKARKQYRAAKEEHKQLESAAVKIQAVYRGGKTREQFKQQRQQQSSMSMPQETDTSTATTTRTDKEQQEGLHQQQQQPALDQEEEQEADRRQTAAVKIQCFARTSLAKRRAQRAREERELEIQLMLEEEMRQERETQAAIAIQALYRGWSTRAAMKQT